MNKLTLYHSDLRHIRENKYATTIILESNLDKVITIESPAIAVFDDTMLQIELETIIDANYIKYELDTKILYYFVESINYSISQGIYLVSCKLDIWHTYITDFWNQATIDKDQLLNITQATVRDDIANKTTYLYQNPYLSHRPNDLNIEPIPVLNYQNEIIYNTPLITETNISEGFPVYTTMDETYIIKWTEFYDIWEEKSISILVVNTNKIASTDTHPPLVFIPLLKSTADALDKDVPREVILSPITGLSPEQSITLPTWNFICGSDGLAKENVMGIYKIPLPSKFIDFSHCQNSLTTSQYGKLKIGGYEVDYFIPTSGISGNKNSDSYIPSIINKSLVKYLDADTWEIFYTNLIKLPNNHSSLLMYYSLNTYIFSTTFKQTLMNTYSNNPIDKPYFTFNLATNGISFSYNIDYSTYYKVFRYDNTLADTITINYNVNPYWQSFPNYLVHYGTIDLMMPSISDAWKTYEVNHLWTTTTGLALQKASNITNSIGSNVIGGLALGGMIDGPIGAVIGAGIGLVNSIANSAIREKQIAGQYNDIKHTPAPLNSGNNMLYIFNDTSNFITQIEFLKDSDISNANYYFKYYGNIVSQPMSLNEYSIDKRPNNDFNYLKISNFSRALKLPASLNIIDYFTELFANGVRIWMKQISFSPLAVIDGRGKGA